MRTRSPDLRKGVRGAPSIRPLHDALFGDAGIAAPALANGLPGPPSASRLETVPEPMIVPADSARVRAAWAMSRAEIEGHVVAGVRPPERRAIHE